MMRKVWVNWLLMKRRNGFVGFFCAFLFYDFFYALFIFLVIFFVCEASAQLGPFCLPFEHSLERRQCTLGSCRKLLVLLRAWFGTPPERSWRARERDAWRWSRRYQSERKFPGCVLMSHCGLIFTLPRLFGSGLHDHSPLMRMKRTSWMKMMMILCPSIIYFISEIKGKGFIHLIGAGGSEKLIIRIVTLLQMFVCIYFSKLNEHLFSSCFLLLMDCFAPLFIKLCLQAWSIIKINRVISSIFLMQKSSLLKKDDNFF